MADWTPHPPEPRPLRATHHCRHYGYAPGAGPTCALGVNNRGSGGALPCMPGPQPDRVPTCSKREDYSAAERAAWLAWYTGDHMARMVVIMKAIHAAEGGGGRMPCPGCGVGTLSWSRARNGHVHAKCSTPDCFSVVQ